MAIRRGSSGSLSEASTLTISSDLVGPSKKAKPRKATMFNRGPKSGDVIDNKPYSWNSVRSKSLSQRRTDRLDDTTKWLDSKGMLSQSDKKWLAGLSTDDKAKLTKLLKVNKYFSGGVKNAADRNKIRAQVVLMAVRTRNLGMATIHRGRLTQRFWGNGPRLYKSLNERSFFDPRQVAAESNLRRATDALAATSYSIFRGSNDMGYTGPRLDKAKRTDQAVTSLLDKGLLDQDSATRLTKVLKHETHRVNILMNIDEKKVPDKADRQKIRQAVLLRAAHFGTDEARAFKTKLMVSGKVSVSVDTPKVDKQEVRQDVRSLATSKDSIHRDNAPRDLNPMYVGNPNEQDVNFLDDDRALDLSFDVACHKQLFPLAEAGDPDGAAREQWDAIADKDYEPRTGMSAHGGDAASMTGAINDIIDHTLDLNDIEKDDFAARREDAMTVLQGVNHLLPKNISLEERSQALAEAAAIFLQPTGKENDGKAKLGNLDRAIQNWPKRQINLMFESYDDRTKHLEDAGFLRNELSHAARSQPIGVDYVFSPPLRELMDDVKTENLDAYRQQVRPTLDAVFGDELDGSGKNDALRYTFKQNGFHGREALFRQSCLGKMQGDDAAEVKQIMQPLNNAMGKIVAANPPSYRAPDGGRQGPHDPKLGGDVRVDPRQGGIVSYDQKVPITGRGNQPSVLHVQVGAGSHQAMLGNILMSTFLQNYQLTLQEKVDNKEITQDEARNGSNKAKTKEALRDAVKQTAIDCKGLENASRDEAHRWIKLNKKNPMTLRTAKNIAAGRVKGRQHTAQQLRKLNANWKKDMQAPDKPVYRLGGSIDDDVVDNGIIEVEE